ncbi:MAG: 30S ribosomal protein S13 [Nanoarchaeota archaeon]|nr:30S ribosomal protein S13 [Nanoarchaeota archaeon]
MAEQKIQEKQIIRIMGTDITGNLSILKGISKIKGIGHNLAQAICIRMNFDNKKQMNAFSDEEFKKLESELKEMKGIDSWLLNRQKDYDSGENLHLLTSDLKLQNQFDRKRLQKIKSYRGLRLSIGLPVRGQRTKAHFRKGGKAVGVKKKGKK